MSQSKAIIIATITLLIGLAGGFTLRPMITATGPTVATKSNETRGTQYFVAHINDARQVVAGCRDGSVRGEECATAEEAIIKVDARERRQRFLGK